MTDEGTSETPDKPVRASRAKASKPEPEAPEGAEGAGINASITGDLKGPRQEPDLPDDDPGINANVVS